MLRIQPDTQQIRIRRLSDEQADLKTTVHERAIAVRRKVKTSIGMADGPAEKVRIYNKSRMKFWKSKLEPDEDLQDQRQRHLSDSGAKFGHLRQNTLKIDQSN